MRCLARRRVLLLALGTVALVLVIIAPASASDVYGNIGPASQLPAGGLFGRYPLANYQLDQYFPGIKVGVLSGVDVSGVPPLIAFFIAQVIWMVTAFIANTLITLFAFAFSLDLLNGNGTPGSGALTPVSDAIHSLYANTFGTPWLIVAILLAGLWAMWKALVQRRYAETAGALAISLLYCVLAIAIVAQPQRTIAPASRLSNELSAALLSATSQGDLSSQGQAKRVVGDQLFRLLVLDPWTVLEFGGIEHCARVSEGKAQSVAVRPLSADPSQDAALGARLAGGTEVQGQGKTCVNDANKYAPHFLGFPFQSSRRNSEHDALEHGSDQDLPASDPAKGDGSYPLGPVDEPAAEAMGKGGQYQRLLLAIVIAFGELGAFLLLGALALSVILAQVLLLLMLAFAPVALVVGVFPGRGHDFFRAWLSRLVGFLARKVVYSLILALVLTVCQALADSTSNLGWLMSFLLQAAFLWAVFLQRHRLSSELLAVPAGPQAARDGVARLQALYYTSRLTRMAGLHRRHQPASPATGGGAPEGGAPSPLNQPPGSEHGEPLDADGDEGASEEPS
jgi:hypothetical protein